MAVLKIKTAKGWVKVCGNEPIEIEYNDLKALITDSKLEKNQQYIITDFATTVDTSKGVSVDTTEQAITKVQVIAKSTNELYEGCTFPEYPEWVGAYSFDGTGVPYVNTTDSAFRGAVTALEDGDKNYANFDFKHIKIGTDFAIPTGATKVRLLGLVDSTSASNGIPQVFVLDTAATNIKVAPGVDYFTIPVPATGNVTKNLVITEECVGTSTTPITFAEADTATEKQTAWISTFLNLTGKNFIGYQVEKLEGATTESYHFYKFNVAKGAKTFIQTAEPSYAADGDLWVVKDNSIA